MIIEFIKFIVYLIIIVVISKYLLVYSLRKLAKLLDLKPKIVGNISGYATSIPELLTITASSVSGLMDASIVNAISSNMINIFQYVLTIFMSKNHRALKNKAVVIDLILSICTIIIPLILISIDKGDSIEIIPVYILLYIVFRIINNNCHKIYSEINIEEKSIEGKNIKEKETRLFKNGMKIRKVIRYILYLFLSGLLLYIVGDCLRKTIEILCNRFYISQIFIGILLGFMTSLPELISFIEAQRHYKRENNNILGVVEASNNLLTSNVLNLFVFQSLGIVIAFIYLYRI